MKNKAWKCKSVPIKGFLQERLYCAILFLIRKSNTSIYRLKKNVLRNNIPYKEIEYFYL